MYRFPQNLYADIRIEDVFSTTIRYENSTLRQNAVSREKGAFLRVYDGKRWYYSAVTDLSSIQAELDALAAMATPNSRILLDPVVQRFEVNQEERLLYASRSVKNITAEEKRALAEAYLSVPESISCCSNYSVRYLDNYTEKQFFSSLGAALHFDYQQASIVIGYTFSAGSAPFSGQRNLYRQQFTELSGQQKFFQELLNRDLFYAEHAVPVQPGNYTCVLSPSVAGVFAHESFGHKSEADLMLGSEAMQKEWTIGARVGADILNIYDTGIPEGAGYVPYDDEGTRARKTALIRNGQLAGRLHSAETAAVLDEAITGNARAVSFEFEPIVRMTGTYIDAGTETFEQLLAPVQEGIFIETFRHGSGMSTFTIAPETAYMIRNGKLAEPVKISVITGNVMQTLHEIDGLSRDAQLISPSTGGCGKMEQYPLRVAFGGPYVRVRNMYVQ